MQGHLACVEICHGDSFLGFATRLLNALDAVPQANAERSENTNDRRPHSNAETIDHQWHTAFDVAAVKLAQTKGSPEEGAEDTKAGENGGSTAQCLWRIAGTMEVHYQHSHDDDQAPRNHRHI